MKFAVVLNDVFADHINPPGHPEQPQRIRYIAERLRAWERFAELDIVEPAAAQEEWLLAVHSPQHVERVRATQGRPPTSLDLDTYAGGRSWETALLAAGSTVRLTEMVLKGEADSGFALVRPPGHHAESSRAMGFCLFNNIAVAAQWAIANQGLERVAVIDFDVHHGNGTQEIFEDRADVLYLSAHQHPLYPGTGLWREQGRGEGKGFTANFPIPAGIGNAFYLGVFDEFVIPILEEYSPQVLLVSAGYDAHRDDPLANLMLDESGFGEIAARLNRTARKVCQGRVVYVLEGGYNLQALASSVQATIEATLDQATPTPNDMPAQFEAYLRRTEVALSEHWGERISRKDAKTRRGSGTETP